MDASSNWKAKGCKSPLVYAAPGSPFEYWETLAIAVAEGAEVDRLVVTPDCSLSTESLRDVHQLICSDSRIWVGNLAITCVPARGENLLSNLIVADVANSAGSDGLCGPPSSQRPNYTESCINGEIARVRFRLASRSSVTTLPLRSRIAMSAAC